MKGNTNSNTASPNISNTGTATDTFHPSFTPCSFTRVTTVARIKTKRESCARCILYSEHHYFPVNCTCTAICFQWIFYLNSYAGLQLTHSMPLEVWHKTSIYNRVCRLPQMVQIKGSLTSHSTDKEVAHPALPTMRTVSPNMPASRDITDLMLSLRTHSYRNKSYRTGLSRHDNQAKQARTRNPAIQQQWGQLYKKLLSSALGAPSIRSTSEAPLLPTALCNSSMKPSNL